MHNPESILENEMLKILWDFEMQTDHLIPARRPYLGLVNKEKRTCQIVDFAVTVDDRVKLKESEKRYKWLDLAREQKKKTMELESDSDTNCNWCVRYSHHRIGSGSGGLGNKRTCGDHPNYRIAVIG